MCGIAGIARASLVQPGDLEAVTRMLAAEFHRGPDGDGIYQDSGAILGHRRLSIIDLSPAGAQPMSNEDGAVRVTFNGEIYNHQDLRSELMLAGHLFRSRTDTEVLVHGYEQWGIEGLLQRLRGMFAFALYDQRRGLILARDRLGIKPLYYHEGADCLLFASEVKALCRSGLISDERDPSALTGFLMAGAVPEPRTIFKGIRCLSPGHWAQWHEGSLTLRRYWDFPIKQDGGTGFSLWSKHLPSLLEDTVQRHLISDVPLGVFLSGGVDSAALVALARRARLATLTVVFDEHEYCESSPASQIAKRFGTSHSEIRVTSAEFKRELPAFLAAMDQPTNDGVNSYFVSKAARAAGLTVVLSGLGGDEVFWGYKHYRWLTALRGPVYPLLARAGRLWGRLRRRDNWLRAAWLKPSVSTPRLYLTLRGFFAPDQVARLMDLTQAELDSAIEEHFGFSGAVGRPSATAFNYVEMKRYLHDQLLRDTDVFSMAHSIEARVPYLDHVLVEHLWNVPAAQKLDRTLNKPLLVRAVNDPAVREAASRPKRGFTFPMARWMKTAAPELQEMAETGFLGRKAVHDCWTDFTEGRMHWSRPWALTVLGAR
jgi:asparagine synthase (glutamine-hydrolysing)